LLQSRRAAKNRQRETGKYVGALLFPSDIREMVSQVQHTISGLLRKRQQLERQNPE